MMCGLVTGTADSRAGGSWWVTTALFVGALAAFLLLRQRSLHGLDIHYLLRWFESPCSHAQHPAWLPLARGLHVLLAPLGARPWETMCALSALGTALGVAFLHRAALVGATPGRSVWTALLAGTLPAVVHFATVAEMHGAFFAAAGLSWWAAASLAHAPRAGRAALLGLCGGTATLIHASGIALPVLWLCCLPALGLNAWRRLPGLVALAGAVHAAVTVAGLYALRALWPPILEGDVDTFLRDMFRASDPLPALRLVLWWEWLYPYAAASFAALVLLALRTFRRDALLLHAATAVLLAACAVLLYAGNHEHGAYLLPLAFPLAWLLAGAFAPALLAIVLLGNVAATAWHLAHPDRPPADTAFGTAVAALERERNVSLLVGDWAEYDGVLQHQAPAFTTEFEAATERRPRCGSARLELQKLRVRWQREPDADALRAWLRLQVADDAARGNTLLITDQALAMLRRELPAFAAAWDGPLPGIERTRIERGALRGTELAAR